MKHTLFKLFLTVLLLTGYGISTKAVTFTKSGIKYETSGSTATVVSNSYSGSVVIPSSVYNNGTTYSVISIGNNAFYYCTGLTSVTIPSSVTSIGNYAFYRCTGLTSITIPNSVTSIGEYAFNRCTGLTSITISNSVTSIGLGVFCNCSGLTSVTIPNSVTSIGEYAFSDCNGLTSINIPNSVTSIGASAFERCTGLTSVTIPNSLRRIKQYAFYGCTSLTSITIPSSVTFIGSDAFKSCSGLTTVILLGNGSLDMGVECFYGCSSLTSFTIEERGRSSISIDCYQEETEDPDYVNPNQTFVGGYGATLYVPAQWYNSYENSSPWNLFSKIKPKAVDFVQDGIRYVSNSDGLTVSVRSNSYSGDVVIPTEVTYQGYTYPVTSIRYDAFSGCSSLTSVTIPSSVTTINGGAFSGCSNLSQVHISDLDAWCRIDFNMANSNPLYYAHHLYLNGDEVKSLMIPNSVISIKEYAFSGCIGLTSVTIPNSVTSIGNAAFQNCTGLTSITIPNSVTSIGNDTFSGCSGLTSIEIPNSVTSIGYQAFSGCSGLTSVILGNSVTSIGSSAFYGCSNLTSINIPNSVTSISSHAFQGCTSLPVEGSLRYADTYLVGATETLTTYNIKEGTKFIGSNAFDNNSSLTSITIPSSVISIGYNAFLGTGLTSVIIPNSVISIDANAFEYCHDMTSLTIGNSVTSIGEYAFAYGGLTEVIAESLSPCIILYSTVFQNATTATLYVPTSAVASYQAATYWRNFSSIQPISLTLDQTNIGRNAGETQTLVATVVPANYASKLTWESSDPTVATVSSDGTVTAVGAGTATVTASLPSGATATCAVTVIPTGTDIALNGNVTSETIAALSDFFTHNEVNSVDLTGATSIADGITIPVNGNCIIYAPAGTTLGNTNNVVVNGVCDNLVVSDGQTFEPTTAFTAANASYSRTNLDNAWGTVCLPYEVSSDDNVTYYTAGTISGDVLTLTSAETLPAGTPAIYKSHSESGGKYSLNATSTSVSVVTTVQTESVTTDDITLVGSFEKTVIDDVKTDAANEYYYINGGQFWHATKKLTINPFRAYFTVPKSVAPSNGFSIAVDEDDVTALSALTGEGDTTVVGIYSIDGKPQSDLQTGLNIVKLSNGKTKKILIK